MLFPTFTAKGPKTGIIYKPFSSQKERKKFQLYRNVCWHQTTNTFTKIFKIVHHIPDKRKLILQPQVYPEAFFFLYQAFFYKITDATPEVLHFHRVRGHTRARFVFKEWSKSKIHRLK